MTLSGTPALSAMNSTLMPTAYMWNKVLHSIWKSIGVMLLFYVAGITVMVSLRPLVGDGVVNLCYFFAGMCFLLPAILA